MSTATSDTSNAVTSNNNIWNRVKKTGQSVGDYVVSKGVNAKELTLIHKLKYDIQARKKKFGVDYLTLKLNSLTTENDLQACLDEALADVAKLNEQILEKELIIGNNEEHCKQVLSSLGSVDESDASTTATQPPAGGAE